MNDAPTTTPLKLYSQRSFTQILTRLWPYSGAAEDIASIDGLRGIAVSLVILMHILLVMMSNSSNNSNWVSATYNFWSFGATGVQLFFVLSGFLLFLPYSRALLGTKALPSTKKFYIRRALRILPAYWTSLFLIVLVSQQNFLGFLKMSNKLEVKDVVLHIFLLQNWSTTTLEKINGPFWTMAVESQFYLLLPLVAAILYKLSRSKDRRTLFAVVIIGFLISPGYALLNWLTESLIIHSHITILLVFNYFLLFEIGMGCSFIYIASKESQIRAKFPIFSNESFIIGIAVVGIILLFLEILSNSFIDIAPQKNAFIDLLDNILLGAGYGCLLLGAVLGKSIWRNFLSLPAIRFLGIISYSLYIWNWIFYEKLIEKLVGNSQVEWITFLGFIISTLLIIIPFCYLFYQFIEKPFIGLRRNQRG